jgi:glycosyltransferase involved in cell wall biosynthesis
MHVSVITVTHNRARLIGETIASVLGQTHRDFEYLIVDDGSTDDTEAVVRAFADPRIRYVRAAHVGRLSVLRQRSVEMAIHDWIAFVDSDDLWLPRKLEAQLQRVAETGAAICAAGVSVFSAGGERVPYGDALERGAPDLFDLNVRRGIVLLYVSALLFERSLVQRLGGFDATMKCGEHDFFTRAIAAVPSTIVKEPLVRVRRHDDNGTDRDLGGANAHEEYLVTLDRLRERRSIDGPLYRRQKGFHHYAAGSLLMRDGRWRDARRHLLAAALMGGRPGCKAALKYLYALLRERRAGVGHLRHP